MKKDLLLFKLLHASFLSNLNESKTTDKAILKCCRQCSYIDTTFHPQEPISFLFHKKLNRLRKLVASNYENNNIALTCLTASVAFHLYCGVFGFKSYVVYAVAKDGAGGKIIQHAWLEYQTKKSLQQIDIFNQIRGLTVIKKENYLQDNLHQVLL